MTQSISAVVYAGYVPKQLYFPTVLALTPAGTPISRTIRPWTRG